MGEIWGNLSFIEVLNLFLKLKAVFVDGKI